MYSESLLHDLLPLIYQAATEPQRWASFLERYQEILEARNIVLAHFPPEQQRTLVMATGADQTDIRKYYQYSCPWLDRLMAENWQTLGR